MRGLTGSQRREISEYLLSDYAFLEDYEVLESTSHNGYSFVANIKNTDQKVRFIRRLYSDDCLPRFRALHRLYKNGIILADNMFILEEGESFFFYIIEAEIERNSSRFETLQQYLHSNELKEDDRKELIGKVKILVDCLHQEGQSYAGLDPRKVVVDQERHLYLAPFDLQLELKTDNYSRAYYSPQLLIKMDEKERQINEDLMQKWDVWAFGCICLQLLLFQSPPFMVTSIRQQLSTLHKFKVQSELSDFQSSIRNVVANSLLLDIKKRTISTHPVQQMQTKKQVFLEAISSLSTVQRQPQQQSLLRELNLFQREEGDYELILTLFSLSSITFDKELRITVIANRNYNFYIDYDEKTPKKYPLNRKITIRSSFDDLQEWMSKPVVIELKEEDKTGTVNVNLQAMILKQNGKRVWKDQIIGNYSSPSQCDFPKVRLKIGCSLEGPPEPELAKVSCSPEPLSVVTNKKQSQYFNEDITVGSKCASKSKEENRVSCQKHSILKQSKTNSLPTISQISQSISLIAEQFKRKMMGEDCKEPVEDDIQQRLSSLLEIEEKQ